MSLAAGHRLGPYEILAPIGAGGMGEVYRARDTKLGREIALKVLPEVFSRDPERLARFEREARLLASLNHASIGAIHGLENFDGVRFLVLELIPGETLEERLSRGPLPLRAALDLCRQIAEALEAAHEKGIIHRDLKPANIKILEDGKVKLLDFGLAKGFIEESRPHDSTVSPTITSGGTRHGVILGTAAYMSPEQARGKPVDKRTDVWSFGCVLFEMLGGQKPFSGETVSDTIARILEREPDWRALPPTTPVKIRDLLLRCLRKDARQRLHDAADARIEIEEALNEPAQKKDIALAAGVPRSARSIGIVAAIAAAVLLGVLLGWAWHGGAAQIGARLTQVARLTHDSGLSEWPTWSPDGTLLGFASNRGGNFEIYVRRVDGGQEVNVTNDPAEDFQPAFSPDGKSLAFVSTRSSRTGMIKIGGALSWEIRAFGGDLWVVPALGGQARRLAQDANSPAWSPDGSRIAYVSGLEGHRSILEIPADGGEPRILLARDSSDLEIVRLQYSPGGTWLCLNTVAPDRVMLMPAAGGKPHEVVKGSYSVWDGASRQLYFATRDPRGGTRLQVVQMEEARGTPRGEIRTVGLMTGSLRDLALPRDGRHLAVSEMEGAMNLTLLPLKADGGSPAGPEVALSKGQVIDRNPQFSTDGKRIAYYSDRLGKQEGWILDLDTHRQERLQLPGEDLGTVGVLWFPDGRRIMMTRMFEGPSGLTYSMWLTALDGSHSEVILPGSTGGGESTLSRDGRRVAYIDSTPQGDRLMLLDLASRKPSQIASLLGENGDPTFSPDGRWIAFTSDATGTRQAYRIPSGGGEPQRLTSGSERMRHLFFSPDGHWLYVQPSHRNIWRLPWPGGPLQQVTRFPESDLFLEEPTISPDGRSLAYSRNNSTASLWLLTLESGRGELTPKE